MNEKNELNALNIEVNKEALAICADDKRHYQMATFTVMVIFVSANTALILPLEYLEKSFGAAAVGLLGLASVVISFVSAMEPRRSWFRAMRKGFEIQEGLKEWGIAFIANPFGSTPARGGARTTHLVHAVVAFAWVFYLGVNGVLSAWWNTLSTALLH